MSPGYTPLVHPYDEMKSWIDFEAQDQALLRALWSHVRPHRDALADRYYERLFAYPSGADLVQDEEQAGRVKGMLRSWVEEMLCGPWDLEYYERRGAAGRMHVEVGVAPRCVFAAMTGMREGLCAIARSNPDADATFASVGKATDLDLAIMTGTYVESRESAQMASLQELIVSHMPVTVLLLDSDGVVTAATRPDTRLFGDVPAVGHRYLDALPRALVEAAELESQMERALATGHEITITRVDVAMPGGDRNFRVSIVPLDHPQARVLLHLEELTDAIRAESRLARAESLAQLGELSAAVAHELRNPLAGISGAIQVIARSLPDDDRRKAVMTKVEDQVRRLNMLVTDLLDFARPPQVNLVPVQLDEIAGVVAELVQRQHPGVTLRVEGQGVASGDRNLLHQVLLHLILNAVQALEGVGEVRVDVGPGFVRVNDAGPGIPPELLRRVFDPFFTTRTRGTGLGLAICQKLVTAMGGRLLITTGPLPGAALVVELPQ